MNTKKRLALAMLAALFAVPASADYNGRIVGEWLTSATEDRFGDGGTYIAMNVADGLFLAVRCIRRELSLAVLMNRDRAKQLDIFKFKFKVDKNDVVDVLGLASDARLVELPASPALVKQLRDGKEAAMRMEDKTGVVSTHIYSLRGSSKAFRDLQKECPLDGSAKSEK